MNFTVSVKSNLIINKENKEIKVKKNIKKISTIKILLNWNKSTEKNPKKVLRKRPDGLFLNPLMTNAENLLKSKGAVTCNFFINLSTKQKWSTLLSRSWKDRQIHINLETTKTKKNRAPTIKIT